MLKTSNFRDNVVLIIGRSAKNSLEAMLSRGFRFLGLRAIIFGYEDFCSNTSPWLASIARRRLLVSRARSLILNSVPCISAFNRHLLRIARMIRPTIALVVKGEALDYPVAYELREHSVCAAYMNPDDPRFTRLTISYADLGYRVFTPCRGCMAWFRERGIEPIFLPFAADIPPWAKWHGCSSSRLGIFVFIGSMYPRRFRVIRELLRRGLPVIVAGPGWDKVLPGRVSGGVYGTRYIALNRLALASLNIHIGSDIGYKANMRVFEIPGSGGIEISDNPEEVRVFYSANEVYTYNNIDELVELAKELIDTPRELLCDRAYKAFKKTVANHTYMHRAKKIIRACT